MPLSLAVYVLTVLAALSTPGDAVARQRQLERTRVSDSVATTAIVSELRAYYRDLHDRNWTSIVTHFYPAKVTARFAVPDGNSAWAALAAPPVEPHESPDFRGYCAPNATVVVVGHWARVRARRCGGELDEAWFYSMSGRWKIIHLVSGSVIAA